MRFEVNCAKSHHCVISDGRKTCCKECKDSLATNLENIDFRNEQEPCSYFGIVHYSYNYAQQLHYPGQQTHISLDLYISKPQENVVSSGYAARALRDK